MSRTLAEAAEIDVGGGDGIDETIDYLSVPIETAMAVEPRHGICRLECEGW